MAIKSHSFLLIFTFLVASTFVGVSTALGGRKALPVEAIAPAPDADDEAFVTLNTKDPKVVELAKFAVDEYNKEHKAELNFSRVFEAAYTYNSKGVNYGLVIAATDETGLNGYDANVLVNKDAKKLVAFWKNE